MLLTYATTLPSSVPWCLHNIWLCLYTDLWGSNHEIMWALCWCFLCMIVVYISITSYLRSTTLIYSMAVLKILWSHLPHLVSVCDFYSGNVSYWYSMVRYVFIAVLQHRLLICTLSTYPLQQDIFDIRNRNVIINVYQYAFTYIVACEINVFAYFLTHYIYALALDNIACIKTHIIFNFLI